MAVKLDKNEIIKALKTITVPGEGGNMVETGAVRNVQVFGDEVIVDITITNPSLQARKKTEVSILQQIHKEVYQKAKITVNVQVDAPAKPQAPTIRGNAIPGISNVIAVASGKGGVGKSTVTANLAVTLAKMGFQVGVLDADIYGPSQPRMLGVSGQPESTDGKTLNYTPAGDFFGQETFTYTVRPWPIPLSKMPACMLTPKMPGIEFIIRLNNGIISAALVSC